MGIIVHWRPLFGEGSSFGLFYPQKQRLQLLGGFQEPTRRPLKHGFTSYRICGLGFAVWGLGVWGFEFVVFPSWHTRYALTLRKNQRALRKEPEKRKYGYKVLTLL